MNDEEPELRPMSAWEFWGTLTLVAVVLGCASAVRFFA